MTIGSFNTLLDDEEGQDPDTSEEVKVVHCPSEEQLVGYVQTAPPEKPDVSKEMEDIEQMTPEMLAVEIRALILTSRKSRLRRGIIRKGDLKALSAWERELTLNYGVKK